MRLLIVDDEPSVLAAISAMIKALRPDWHAEYVTDADEALRRLHGQRYDVVLTDLQMPKLDGISMIQQAKLPFTSVVFLTGYKERYASAAWRLGAFAVLDKPVHKDLLIKTLEAANVCRGTTLTSP